MRLHWPFVLAIAVAACTGPEVPTVESDPEPRGCGPTLVHDADWYGSGSVQRFLPGLDGLSHPITIGEQNTASRRDSIQRYFDQGLVLAYGFNHAEAARSFWQATRLDSTCAMAWWGFAYVLGPNYNAGMEPDNYARAHAAIVRAVGLKGGCTVKERGLIDAMAMRYVAEPVKDRAALDKAYSDAMRKVADAYRDDPDVAVLFAESLMDLHPWDLWDKEGEAKPWTPEIIAALERSLKLFPEHFGAHHLYIHAVEASRTPERGLRSAAFLADAVPGSGHLVHMPSHIHIRTGRYHEGMLANQRSVAVDSGYTAQCHAAGIYPLAYFPHNIHFLSICAAFAGEKKAAWKGALMLRERLADDLLHVPEFSTLQHYQAYPWMVAVKLGLWEELAAQAAPGKAEPYAMALWHFAQGVRHARAGKVEPALLELEGLQAGMRDSVVQEMTIWGINSAQHVLRVAGHVLLGEIAAARKDHEAAIAHFTSAVEAEDSLQYQEPPDWSFPARHELGAVLLRTGKAEEAERVYREDLVIWPENGYALEGLRDALLAQDRKTDAAALAPRISAAWAHADR